MLKLLVFESDLDLLHKMKALLSSISIFHEVKISNDEKTCLKMIKDEYFDIYILKIPDNKFKELLVGALPDIVTSPVLCTNDDIDMDAFDKHAKLHLTKDNFNLLSLLSMLSDLVPKNVLESSGQLIQEYVPIKLTIFRNISITPCDVYIKLGEDKYVKIINNKEEIHTLLLDRYERRVNHFYIRKIDFYRCADRLFSHTLPQVQNFESKADYYSQSQQVIRDIVFEIGINENVMKLADELVDTAVTDLKDQKFSDLLSSFKYSKERYIYDHSVLTSIFAIALCEKFEWRNRLLMQKVAFAAVFHDFAFQDPKLALFEAGAKTNENLTREQKNEILNHPQKMVSFLSTNKSISSEVLSIIGKHHEAHGENSYPSGLTSASLSILECVFLVAHEFANELYKIAFSEDKIAEAVQNVLEFSNAGNLKQVRVAFTKVVAEKYQIKV